MPWQKKLNKDGDPETRTLRTLQKLKNLNLSKFSGDFLEKATQWKKNVNFACGLGEDDTRAQMGRTLFKRMERKLSAYRARLNKNAAVLQNPKGAAARKAQKRLDRELSRTRDQLQYEIKILENLQYRYKPTTAKIIKQRDKVRVAQQANRKARRQKAQRRRELIRKYSNKIYDKAFKRYRRLDQEARIVTKLRDITYDCLQESTQAGTVVQSDVVYGGYSSTTNAEEADGAAVEGTQTGSAQATAGQPTANSPPIAGQGQVSPAPVIPKTEGVTSSQSSTNPGSSAVKKVLLENVYSAP